MKTAMVKREGDRVMFVLDGKCYMIPALQAREIAKLLNSAAARVEEIENATKIIADGALLARVGFPIGLSNDPKIKDEVRKEAAFNRELRRAIPGSVKSREVFGVPSLTHTTNRRMANV